MEKKQLPDEVGAKYDYAGQPVGTYDIPGHGIVSFSKISLAEADQLAAKGYPHLVAKAAPAAPALSLPDTSKTAATKKAASEAGEA